MMDFETWWESYSKNKVCCRWCRYAAWQAWIDGRSDIIDKIFHELLDKGGKENDTKISQ